MRIEEAMKPEDVVLLDGFRKAGGGYVTPKVGDEITGIVTGIEPYGVFIENYETRINGLIHNSRMVHGVRLYHQADYERHFRMGDTVTARVEEIRQGGKLSLSTLGYDLPTYGINASGSLIKRESTKVTENPSEIDEILEEMRAKVGGVSKQAHNRIQGLVGKYGVIKFTIALAKALDTYTPIDQSMLLVDEIEKQTGVKSPKRTFIIGDHAKQRWGERGDGGDLMERVLKAKLMYEDEHISRRLYGDGEFVFPCLINEKGENIVKTVKLWGM